MQFASSVPTTALSSCKSARSGWHWTGQLRRSLPRILPVGQHLHPVLNVRVGQSRGLHSRRPRAALQPDDLAGGSGEDELKNGDIADEVPGLGELGESRNAAWGGKTQRRFSTRRDQRKAYFFAAIASTTGFTTMAVGAVYYRFVWRMPANGEVPYTEILGTFSLAAGAAVGMEYWARWAHKALWHASLWHMHESHHRPRDGPFEMNDVFAIINAVPAISLMLFGFLNKGLVPGLCFGAGLGITMFGIAYMFVHDGLVHRRFPVGPVADVPYLQKVAAAHQLHHADLFDGVPYGLFLGPKELERVGGEQELEKLMKQRARTPPSLK